MSSERMIRIIAGSFIVASVLLFNATSARESIFAGVNWLWFTLFVGVNLLQSGITKWCLMESLLRKVRVGTR